LHAGIGIAEEDMDQSLFIFSPKKGAAGMWDSDNRTDHAKTEKVILSCSPEPGKGTVFTLTFKS